MSTHDESPNDAKLGLRLTTVSAFIEHNPQFSLGWLRKTIFHSKQNGFDRVIIHLGRKVLLDLDRLEEWLKQHRVGDYDE